MAQQKMLRKRKSQFLIWRVSNMKLTVEFKAKKNTSAFPKLLLFAVV